MKLISWNIRGLNSPRKGKLLKNLIMEDKPTILFLQETKCNSITLERIAATAWPGGQVTTVDAQGTSGGLAILWDAGKIQLNNTHANKNHIHTDFHIRGTNIHGHLSNVYFPQEGPQKAAILENISQLNANRQHPLWINRDGTLLKDFIQHNWLIDIPTANGLFTWTNKQVAPLQIASRLDRFLLSDNAVHLGGEFTAHIIPFSGSDHWPIELHWNWPGNSIKRPFRFEAFWFTHPEFKEFIQNAWQNSNPTAPTKMARFQKKLKMLKAEIKRWNTNTFGHILKEKECIIQGIKKTQQQILSEGRTEELAHKEQEMEGKLLEREKQEEILWRQKSRIRWLKEGEKNTKFFHKSTVQRRMRNHISQIITTLGEKVETQEEIEQEFIQHFKEMSKEPNPVSLQEVETTANSLKAGKAPGPDGFTSNFFHYFWELIKWEVWQVVEESRNMRWMYPGLNATFIALIPKSEESNKPDKYRPIALCNIIYKIVSKVVALRLKPVLPLIISPE
eukprot:PITA_24927